MTLSTRLPNINNIKGKRKSHKTNNIITHGTYIVMKVFNFKVNI